MCVLLSSVLSMQRKKVQQSHTHIYTHTNTPMICMHSWVWCPQNYDCRSSNRLAINSLCMHLSSNQLDSLPIIQKTSLRWASTKSMSEDQNKRSSRGQPLSYTMHSSCIACENSFVFLSCQMMSISTANMTEFGLPFTERSLARW